MTLIKASSPIIQPAVWTPDNTTAQKSLEAALVAAGLDPPSSFRQSADAAIAGICLANTDNKLLAGSTTTSRKRGSALNRRDFWDTYWEVECSDFVGTFTGDAGEALCAGKKIYDQRDAYACFFKGCAKVNAFTPPPITYQHDFDYSWNAKSTIDANTDVVKYDGQYSSWFLVPWELTKRNRWEQVDLH